MADSIERDGETYLHDSYLKMANDTSRRRAERIALLESVLRKVSDCYEGGFAGDGGHIFVPSDVWNEVKAAVTLRPSYIGIEYEPAEQHLGPYVHPIAGPVTPWAEDCDDFLGDGRSELCTRCDRPHREATVDEV